MFYHSSCSNWHPLQRKKDLWSLFNHFTLGKILADAKKETNLINAKINLDIVKEARLAIPNLNAQRKYLTDL